MGGVNLICGFCVEGEKACPGGVLADRFVVVVKVCHERGEKLWMWVELREAVLRGR